MEHQKRIRLISYTGLYIAVAFIFSYIESLFPLPIPFPGIKLGLANLVIVFVLYKEGFAIAFLVSMLCNVLNAFTFGSLFGFWYSLAGSILSLLVMWLLSRLVTGGKDTTEKKKPFFSILSVSCMGAICHNLGQFVVASVLVGFDVILYYFPFLYFSGLVTGVLIGFVADLCVKRIQTINK